LIQVKGYQERRVCRLIGLARSSARYQAQAGKADEPAMVERLKQFAKYPRKRRRGYRLAHAEIQRDAARVGKKVNHKRIYRLWREEGLCVPARRRRKRIRGTSPPRERIADRINAIWCFDFVQEKTIHGQTLRIFCVSDEFTRESLCIDVGMSYVSERVCQTLERLIHERAVPGAFRMDNGPEFIALALKGLCHRLGIDAAYIDPGKPWQNGFAESFHSRLRDEFMDGEVFYGVKDAQVRLSSWRRYFNEERLHSSLGYRTPREFAASCLALEALGASETRLQGTAALAPGTAGTEAVSGT
jgi:transposase InsO family protein